MAVRGVLVGSFLEKDQRERVGRAAARFLNNVWQDFYNAQVSLQ
jgi:uncharacterized membrane protein